VIKNLTVFSNRKPKINKKDVHKAVSALIKILNFSIDSLQINFINSNQILEINKKYLNHHFTTDIITFNYSGSLENLEGELFISTDDAFENAKKFNVDFNSELLRLIIHGILHMIGYEDDIPVNKKRMKLLENKLVKELTEGEEKFKVL
jgi:metalloprotein, YbeY/UPF0054 family